MVININNPSTTPAFKVDVAFFFEDTRSNVSSGIPDATMERWNMNMEALGIDTLNMIDVTTYKIGQYYKHNIANLGFKYFMSLDEVLDEHKGWNIVGVEQDGIPLPEFTHPKEDTLYIVGADSASLDKYDLQFKVNIPAAKPEMPYWAELAAGLVVYDRLFN